MKLITFMLGFTVLGLSACGPTTPQQERFLEAYHERNGSR